PGPPGDPIVDGLPARAELLRGALGAESGDQAQDALPVGQRRRVANRAGAQAEPAQDQVDAARRDLQPRRDLRRGRPPLAEREPLHAAFERERLLAAETSGFAHVDPCSIRARCLSNRWMRPAPPARWYAGRTVPQPYR